MLHIFTGSLAFFKITAYLFSKCSTKYHKLAVCVLQENHLPTIMKKILKNLSLSVCIFMKNISLLLFFCENTYVKCHVV